MCFSLHPLSPACVCAGPTFRRLYGIAGGPLSQSLIYSGPFEIIELTHLSDGERRNAKRSPGEVPAAPTPNLSCLQIAQSLHHNRWDSCLSFFALLAHTLTRARWSVHAIVASAHHTFPHTYTEVQSHQTLVTDKMGKQAETCTVHICRHTHVFPPSVTVSLALTCTLCRLLFLSRSDFHVQGQYQLSTGNIAPSYPEHDKRTITVELRTKGGGGIVSVFRLFISHSTSFIFISELIV